jgi:hypothetical protein
MADEPVQLKPFIVSESKVGGQAPGLKNLSLTQFYNVALRDGFARGYLFRVKNITNVNLGDTIIYATSGKIPDRRVNIATVNYQSYNFRVPMNAEYPDKENWSLNFYCDGKYYIRSVLEDWSKSIYNPDTFTAKRDFSSYNLEMVLLKPDETSLKEIRTYKLIGCIPTLVSTPQYNVRTSGEIVTVNVTMAFQYIEAADVLSKAEPAGLIDKINKFTKSVKNVTGQVKQITSAVNNVATATRTLRNIRR